MIELDVIDPETDDVEEPDEQFWRSRPDLRDDPEFEEVTEEEFLPGASEGPSGASRRQFLQLMGASMAMAGLAACRRPTERILPHAEGPEASIPGVPNNYATAMPFRGVVRGVLVKSNDGRPTKVEGNPDHPNTQGATSAFEQASVLNLYDPDRSREVLRDGARSSWSDFMSFCRGLANGAENREIAVLCEETSSPTIEAMRGLMQDRFPNLRWITYRPEGDDPVRLGMQDAFGAPYRPHYHFDEAEVVVSLDANFLGGCDRNFVENTRTFAASRKLEDESDTMNRLYVAESTFSITGGQADHRLRMKPSRIAAFAAALAEELGVGPGTDAEFDENERHHIEVIADDLREAGDAGVLLAGETQDPAVHALCMAVNEELNSLGTTVDLLDTGAASREPQSEALQELVDEMNAGVIDTAICVGVNPVYDTPAELGFEEALRVVDESVHVGLHVDETARACRWHVPRTHYLEAWSDGRAYDGTRSVIQPLIEPLYDDAHSAIEVLNALATGVDAAGYDIVRGEWEDEIDDDFERGWRRIVHDGYQEETQYETVTESVDPDSYATLPEPNGDIELVFRLDPKLLAGRFSNNAWMQELPEPVTKIVWDNVALMSEATAEEIGVDVTYDRGRFQADTVEISRNGERIELPVWIQPGFPDDTIGVAFGYGRALSSDREYRDTPFWDTDDYTDIYGQGPLAGHFRNGERVSTVGTNVGPLRSSDMERVADDVTVTPTGDQYMIVTTQEHGSLEGRNIYRRGTMEDFQENPEFVMDEFEDYSPGEPYEEYPELWAENHPTEQPAMKNNPYYQNQWGMVVDLNSCTGCNACVVACTSENNVPVVGKEEVGNGRHMYWIRTDRYYVSDEENTDNPDMVTQPMMCQHCENAPCESVCPVAATYHSPDGTNQMVYNRCIGTRYCSNNCPYKVRRFNFYDWTKTLPTEVQMAQNPNVTVRSRGVMEKCTFCIQRVREKQQQASNEDRDLRDGEVKTACQQACPADAIQFGDLNNEDSEVVRQKNNPRRYEALSYLNVKPRLSYLGRVSNPNPRLENGEATPA